MKDMALDSAEGLLLRPRENTTSTSTDLEKRSTFIRRYVRDIYKLLEGPNGRIRQISNRLTAEHPNLEPINGLKDPLERLREMGKTVSNAAKIAAGTEAFDQAVYPYAFSDLSLPLSFSNNILTFDSEDIFDLPNKTLSLADDIDTKLTAKFLDGWYIGSLNHNLISLALDLYIAGVNPDSLRLTQENIHSNVTLRKIGKQIIARRLEMTAAGGQNVVWDSLSNIGLPFSPSDRAEEWDHLISNGLALPRGKKVIIIDKAAENSRPYEVMFAVLPENSTYLISDTKPDYNEVYYSNDGHRVLGLTDLMTDRIRNELNLSQNIQGKRYGRTETSSYGNYMHRLGFGYQRELDSISLAKLDTIKT